MSTKTNFKDISQKGSRNTQKIVHNHAPTEKITEFLCYSLQGLQDTVSVLLREKLRLNKELADARKKAHRLELEMERRRLPLLDLPAKQGKEV